MKFLKQPIYLLYHLKPILNYYSPVKRNHTLYISGD